MGKIKLKLHMLVDHRVQLLKDLQDVDECVGYLNAALEDEDPNVFLLALKDVIDAQMGMTSIAKETGLNRESLYRMLSKRGNPRIKSVSTLLQPLGLHIAVRK